MDAAGLALHTVLDAAGEKTVSTVNAAVPEAAVQVMLQAPPWKPEPTPRPGSLPKPPLRASSPCWVNLFDLLKGTNGKRRYV